MFNVHAFEQQAIGSRDERRMRVAAGCELIGNNSETDHVYRQACRDCIEKDAELVTEFRL
jgi:hypothetical protein